MGERRDMREFLLGLNAKYLTPGEPSHPHMTVLAEPVPVGENLIVEATPQYDFTPDRLIVPPRTPDCRVMSILNAEGEESIAPEHLADGIASDDLKSWPDLRFAWKHFHAGKPVRVRVKNTSGEPMTLFQAAFVGTAYGMFPAKETA